MATISPAATDLARVKCRNCRGTDAFKEARREARNAARRAARKAKVAHAANDWLEKLSNMPGLQRLPRGGAAASPTSSHAQRY